MKKANKLFIKILHDPYIILLGFTLCALAYLFKKTSYFSNPNCLSLLDNEISISIACLSGTIAFLVLLPCRNSDRVKLLLVCCISEICYMFYRHQEHTLLGHLIYIGPSSLLVCVAASLYLVFTSHVNRALIVLDIVSLSLIMPVFLALQFECVNNPYVYDWILLKAELLTKIQICCLVTYLLRSNYALQVFMYIVYTYLPLWMMLAQISSFRRDYMDRVIPIMRSPGPPFLVFLAAAAVGAVCYSYLPAVGPAAFFGAKIFPYGTCPDVALSDVKAVVFINDAMRSCIPCLPLVFVLCAGFTVYNIQPFWNRGWFVLAFFMAASSFSIGGHWAVDSLAALPITACCLGLTWYRVPGKIRWITAAGGGISSFLLLHLIKYDIAWCLDHAVLYWLWVISVNVLSVVGIKYMLNVSREHEYHLVVSRQPYRFLTPARKDDEEDE